MKNFPQYIKVEPSVNGKLIQEWAVRLYKKQIDDESGNKIPTPEHLLNRYYRTSGFLRGDFSIFGPENIFLTYEDIEEYNITVEVFD